MLELLLFLQIDLCVHKRISFLPLFLFFWTDLRPTTLLSDSSLLAHVTGVYSLLQRFGWDD